MKKITKAIIPAAGLGTRLLPITKSIPKELLPIINIPIIQHIVNEAVNSGIKQIIMVISKTKEAIVNYFSINKVLENTLLKKGKNDLHKLVIEAKPKCDIKFVYQDKQLGLADAIYCGKKYIKNEPFAVLLGDDVVVNKNKPALQQCIDAYYKVQSTVVGVKKIMLNNVNKYGIVAPINKQSTKNKLFAINDLIEKPSIKQAPSQYAILGRYVFNYDIFDMIEKTTFDMSHEIQITNSIRLLIKNKKKVFAFNFEGKRYDTGNKLDYVKTIIDFALHDKEICQKIKQFIKEK